MRFWWVNQNQTYRHEVPGGYLWSPKRNQGNRVNPFYEFMREVAPGDVVFSFCDGLIKAIGVAGSLGYESPKPLEFGSVGAYWERIGWRVDVRFQVLLHPIRPAAHMAVLAPLSTETGHPSVHSDVPPISVVDREETPTSSDISVPFLSPRWPSLGPPQDAENNPRWKAIPYTPMISETAML